MVARDFDECGQAAILYFAGQEGFPGIAVHADIGEWADHVHVLHRDRRSWMLADVSQEGAREVLARFISWLREKGISVEEQPLTDPL